MNTDTLTRESNVPFPDWPDIPASAQTSLTDKPFSAIKTAMAKDYIAAETVKRIERIVDESSRQKSNCAPLSALTELLDDVRALPPGDARVTQMNTIVRELGQRRTLAWLLDQMSAAAHSNVAQELAIAKQAMGAKMHSVYGWCGNTILLESSSEPLSATHPCDPRIGDLLGNNTSAWNLTVHIWQPNTSARGFACMDAHNPDVVVEPPHSHPFDFASAVVAGNMHQSIYQPRDSANAAAGHYKDTQLVQVDGVWPPHSVQKSSELTAVEERVHLREGDSYYMPCDRVHDVEINANKAWTQPTITLFLSSEYMVMPHAFICQEMADYHQQQQDIKAHAGPVSEAQWHAKLAALSAYLKGESATLDLNEIVQYPGEYAFFNCAR